jgi:Ribbon-helix-helix protein, copG family
MTNRSYDELADAAERGELRRKPGTRRTGAVATRLARDVMMAATGQTSRTRSWIWPWADPDRSCPRPVTAVAVRACDELYEATERMAAQEGITVSEVVRRAIAAYVMPQMSKPAGR